MGEPPVGNDFLFDWIWSGQTTTAGESSHFRPELSINKDRMLRYMRKTHIFVGAALVLRYDLYSESGVSG